ncbi:hypothetical protein TVD_00440 [Thioalkalivibrio versutus]|uniref:Heparinase n=1 Tax=Thioalkalivibrio versutus TaxID=106634 RepID=A0A0G3G321_9GAMM|nr:hypothetical protein [Thioalkalivibrio versutus]AKJ93922.1 hypothetical protein TVD_00440 [Thioalkalivibrio versutus]
MGAIPIIPPSNPVVPGLDLCLDTLAAALRTHIRPGCGLHDPVDEAPTPADHYGQTGAALALAILDGPDSQTWRRPLEAWETLPAQQTGHAPFNRFLLNLLAEHLERSGARASEVAHSRTLAQGCKLARRYPSNNWTLLARLCELQEANGKAEPRAHARLRGLLDRWTTPSGAFVDYPARPGTPARGATPAAYHHKALFVAVMAAELGEPEAWRPTIERLLRWSLYVWDGHGHAGGLGRSSHALFGDACMVASLLLLGAATDAHQDTASGRMLSGLLGRWSDQIRPDGFLALNPADTAISGTGWDPYMHLSVYNAWAAAIVAWARCRTNRPGREHAVHLDALEAAQPAHMGTEFLRAGTPSATLALVATHGQPPQAFSRDAVELRYAGGVPLHVTWQGNVLCPAPARIPVKALLDAPALAGWTPMFLIDGRLFGLTDFEQCESEASEERLRVTLSGHPRPLLRLADTSLPARTLAALDWRLLDGALGRRAALRRAPYRDVVGTVTLIISLKKPCIVQRLNLEYRGRQGLPLLNPGGHAVTDTRRVNRGFRQAVNGAQHDYSSGDWHETPLPSAIAGGMAFCQSPESILKGTYMSELTLEWPSRHRDAPC